MLNIAVTIDNGSIIYKTYTLIGLIIHSGKQSSSGHYVCFTKSGMQWILHDDNKVFLVNHECIFRENTYKNVYLLTYGSGLNYNRLSKLCNIFINVIK